MKRTSKRGLRAVGQAATSSSGPGVARARTLSAACLLALPLSVWGCSFKSIVGGKGSIVSTDSAAKSGRSLRLDDGFFFGHDVREYESIVYVLDLSGSMSGRTGSVVEQIGTDAAAETGGAIVGGVMGNTVGDAAEGAVLGMDKKIELVKDHLNASLRGLPSGAEFNVVFFSGGVQRLSPTMIGANGVTTNLVSAFVSQLDEGGATSMKRAIEAGFDMGSKDVMVLTDGLPTDSTPDEILQMVAELNADHSRRVSTVGVGADQAKDFLTRLAQDNGGEFVSYD